MELDDFCFHAKAEVILRIAQVELARSLAHSIWHMLIRGEAFAPKGASHALVA